MRYRDLGKTGIKVSEIGFGAWGIGGLSNGATSYGSTDDNVSREALRKAFDEGINFYDTSDVYGYGHSESLIGEVFGIVRSKVVIASKVGWLEHNGPQDFSTQHIMDSLEKSLKRLKTDYLDLYQLHSPKLEIFENDDTFKAMLMLKKQGKIRAIGISARSPSDGVTIINRFGFDSVQVNFNLVDQRAIDVGLFDLCVKKGVGIICRTPLCFGFLTGNYTKGIKFNSSDHRSTWSVEQIEKWASAHIFFSELVNKVKKQSKAQIAIKFCLSYPEVSTVIPGMLNEKEVIENSAASQLGPFSKKELLKMEGVYKMNSFFIKK